MQLADCIEAVTLVRCFEVVIASAMLVGCDRHATGPAPKLAPSGFSTDPGASRRTVKPAFDLKTMRRLKSMQLITNGCFGQCATFELDVTDNGTAQLSWKYPRPAFRASGKIPWKDVTLVLSTARIYGLHRYYPATAVDTVNAKITLLFDTFAYSFNAPDSVTWPPELHGLMTGMCILMDRGKWSRPILSQNGSY